MIDEAPRAIIKYENNPVGYFEDEIVPVRPGRYQYMPFRNLPHLEMSRACAAGVRPRCFVRRENGRVCFEVVTIPEPHVMMVESIERIDEPSEDRPADGN